MPKNKFGTARPTGSRGACAQRRRRLTVIVAAVWSLVVGPPLQAGYLKIGATSGSGNRSFNSSNPITYNFGVTTAGGADNLTAINLDVWVDRGQSATSDIFVTIFNNFGATGSVVATATIPRPASASSTVLTTGSFNPVVSLPAGSYSVRLTTNATGSGADTYQYRQGPLQLTDVAGVPLSSFYWVQDQNTSGQASTTLQAASGVLAQVTMSGTSVNFGNFRVGSTLSQTVQVTNSNLPTSNNYSEALAGTATTAGTASVSGLPTALNQGQSTNLTVGLGSGTAGPVTGNVNLSFTSVQGSSASPGPFGTSVGSSTIAVSGTGFRPATAGFSTTSASLGRFHVGATSVTGTIAIQNTQTASQYSEGLAAAAGATTGGASVISGLPTVTSPLAAGGSQTVTLGLASVANVGTGNTGTVTLGLDTSGVGTSGLSAASIGSQLINVTAQGYSGQSIWQRSGSGTWGNFDDWDVPGGTPGVDGSLSVNDTATFGSAATAATTVNLDGQNPGLASLTFSNAAASYTIAPGSGGSLTMGTSAATGSVTVTAGSHTISTGLALGRNTTFTTDANTRLTIGGALTGSNALTKAGAGELLITSAGGLSGATTVSAGTLRVNGSIASSPVTVASGATLAGSGTVGGTTIGAGGTLSPGNSPGTIASNGTTVWQPGGDYNWQIHDADAGAGTGWDLLSIAGDLDLTNLSSLNKFDINLWSLAAIGPDANGNAIDFDPSQAYTWTIARVTGGGQILGFDADAFNINLAAANGTGGFTNSLADGTITIE
ncbi:MAG: beta strand repeat-containing protein, partial [Planctomycetota bacterium]